mgnify:CR=1 FL=1
MPIFFYETEIHIPESNNKISDFRTLNEIIKYQIRV